MGQLVIDHPQGYDTIFSHEEDSPAYPYVKQHLAPQSVDDLYDLGLIAKSIPKDAVYEARSAGQGASERYLRITDHTLFSAAPSAQRALGEARLNVQARHAMVRATADHLVSALRISVAHAELLASKVHSFDTVRTTVARDKKPYVFSLALQDDLIIKSRLIVAASITLIRARSVLIHRTGEMRMHGQYLLLQCDSIYGPGLWEFLSARAKAANGDTVLGETARRTEGRIP
jgi:hypothetical protein